jgi:transcription initiation factor TFIIIB Brf1 subunit/transcription initiation factor TFIIB
MNQVLCPKCFSDDILFDQEESKKNNFPSYVCNRCGLMISLKGIGQKLAGWRTKAKLKEKEEIANIPF